MTDQNLWNKYEQLKRDIASMGSVAVAFSGGVDSTFLLYAAKEALNDRVIAITAASGSFPKREIKEAADYCRRLGVRQFVSEVNEMDIEGFSENPPERCYLCKRELFSGFLDIAAGQSMAYVAEGSNLDDEGDYRPGMRAIAELQIKSPLRAAGFTKAEIRQLSHELGLPTWDKPSYACLASRFPYGETITAEKLKRIDEAEQYLLNLGFHQMRVRNHGNLARIELLSEDMDRFMQEEIRTAVYEYFQKLGFSYISLDLKGYRTGSMNETLGRK